MLLVTSQLSCTRTVLVISGGLGQVLIYAETVVTIPESCIEYIMIMKKYMC